MATRYLAFDLGAFPSAGAAHARLDELAALGIPTYIVEGAAEGARFRLYAGA